MGDGAVFGGEQELIPRDSRKRKTSTVLTLFVLALLGWFLVNRTHQVAVPHPQRIATR
jgi:hypothetical protein